MTAEQKSLLLQDLCARLPYSVEAQVSNIIEGESKPFVVSKELTFTDVEAFVDCDVVCDIKPYLRPMESMTDEERKKLAVVCGIDYIDDKIVDFGEFLCEGSPVNIKNIYGLLDWLNAHHFDYRGLIEKGLAIEAPEGMYETKTE